ncbi:MAG TPA: aldo/keto reductase [Magnetospirillaceae bacterium]
MKKILPKREIGKTGVFVGEIGLGAMPMSKVNRLTVEQATEVIRAFVDSGGDFIDTADVYAIDFADRGHNEHLIASVMKALGRKEVKIATKGGNSTPDKKWPPSLRFALESSLRSLNTESIFLYQLHWPMPRWQAAIHEMVHFKSEGKIQHIGVSNFNLDQLKEAVSIAPISTVQNRFSLFDRGDFDSGLIKYCAENGITYIAYSPFGGVDNESALAGRGGHADLIKHLAPIAQHYDISPYTLALAGLLRMGSPMLPIPGASSIRSVKSSLAALDLKLDETHAAELDALWKLPTTAHSNRKKTATKGTQKMPSLIAALPAPKAATDQIPLRAYKYSRFTLHLPAGHGLPEANASNPLSDRFLPHLSSYLKPGSIVIDVGANCGDTLASMYSTNKGVKFICIEADPRFFAFLKHNVERLLIQDPAATVWGIRALVGKSIKDASLQTNGSTSWVAEGAGGAKSPTQTIDAILAGAGRHVDVNLLKVDVDGFDYDVIESATELLERQGPALFFETDVHFPYQRAGYLRLLNRLTEYGYTNWAVFDNFGEVILQTHSVSQVKQLLEYIWRQSDGRTRRTIYYFDILAYKPKDEIFYDIVLADFIAGRLRSPFSEIPT